MQSNGSKIPITEKTWKPKLIGDRFEHCAVQTDQLFKLFGKVKRINPDFYNRIESEEVGVLIARITEALKSMLQRVVWFGDTTVDNVSNGGYLKDATDKSFFDILDGIWKQILTTDIPKTSKYYVNIDANDGNSYASQEQMSEDFAYKLFKNMYRKADPRLKQLLIRGGVSPTIHCTSKIAENWQEFKEKKSMNFTLSNAEDGGLKDAFRNITVKARYDWDSVIQSYQDNGTKYNLPNRALLTVKSNIPVGTVNTRDLDTLDSFYDKYHEVNVMDFRLKMDVKFLQDYLAVAAY
ncbi:conserved domain protein [Elysia marginata]|uniref:Conserved domain protein n=1 Tax=Elysia marginata TaxID=1093978 RepID=A0AAV4G4D8_9GAST|nr:conserved domain protein [Elysia marginata]